MMRRRSLLAAAAAAFASPRMAAVAAPALLGVDPAAPGGDITSYSYCCSVPWPPSESGPVFEIVTGDLPPCPPNRYLFGEVILDGEWPDLHWVVAGGDGS